MAHGGRASTPLSPGNSDSQESSQDSADFDMPGLRFMPKSLQGGINLTSSQNPSPSTSQSQSATVPPPSATASVEQNATVRRHLAQLLHVKECRKIYGMNQCGIEFRGFCGTLRSLLLHMDNCEADAACTFERCWSSRKLLYHWKFCGTRTCDICRPIRLFGPDIVSKEI